MTKEDLQAIRSIMQEELEPINNRLDNLEQGQKKIELKIENEVDRSIKVIMEGHTDLNRKMDKTLGLENRVETLENKMTAVEFAIQKR